MSKKEITVVKKDGSRVPYDAAKIKLFIQRACENLNVSQLELESKVDIFIKDGIKTVDISDNIIQHAVQLASPSSPDWVYVAGRSFAMNERAKYKLRDKSFREIVKHLVSKKYYTGDLLTAYSPEQLDSLGDYIQWERDMEHSHGSLVTAKKKYQNQLELNQHMHMVNAMRFGQFQAAETRESFVRGVYDMLSSRETSLATPFMNNLRAGGNIASCFIVAPDDDLGSIFDTIKDIATISKNGGGLGIYVGNLRAKGSSVNGYKNAAGPITQWIRVINDTLVAVNQSFAGDTLIDTQNGSVPINCITEGDLVKTHDGSFKEVIGVRSRLSEDKVFQVKTSVGSVVATGGHPVLVVKRGGYGSDELKQKLQSGEVKPEWVDIDELTSEYFVIKSK